MSREVFQSVVCGARFASRAELLAHSCPEPDHKMLGTDSYGQLAQPSVAPTESGRFEQRAWAWAAVIAAACGDERTVGGVGTDTYGQLPAKPKALE